MEKNNPQSFFLRLCMVAVAIMMAVSVRGQELSFGNYEYLKNLPGKELVSRGKDYLNKNMPDSALLYISIEANRRFYNLSDSVEIVACASAINILGSLYKDVFYDYSKAYYYYQIAEKYSIEHGIHQILPFIHTNLANLKLLKSDIYNTKDYVDVLLEYKQAYKDACKENQYDWLDDIVMNMASLSLASHLVDSVKSELLHFIGLQNNNHSEKRHHSQLLCKSVMEFSDGNVDYALNLLDTTLCLKYSDNSRLAIEDTIIVYELKWQMLIKCKMEKEALKVANEVIVISKNNDYHVGLCDVYRDLFYFFQNKGDENLSMQYELLYFREKDAIINSNKLGQLNEMKFFLEIEKLNREAEAMAMRDRMKSWMLWMVSGFALLIVCLLLFLYLKYKQVKENHHLLYLKSLDMIRTDEEKRLLIEKLEAQIRQYEELEKKEAAHEVHKLDEEKMTNLLHRIFMVMETSDEVYSNDFSMNRLAELVGDTRNNVSEAINRQYKTGFHDLINEYRVKEACRRMNDIEHYGHLTIEYISSELGFKSRTTFIAAFKKNIGLTPSAYLKLAKER